ncbi:hypothetical protein [Algoriphagus sp.]|uniref:hypothetical protein n=1 Tax=Algoriphagus sp. TaxID=1872435 RepID=UPI002608B7B9|nr:hypothetical protein [Algoriphagus sp.]
MKKVGVLLPGSTTHPQMGYDFFFGLKKGLKQYFRDSITLISANIGYGKDEEVLYKEAEQLVLNHDVILLVAFADYPKAEKLVTLSEKLDIPLILVGSGARFPNPKVHSKVWYLNLGELFAMSFLGIQVKKQHQTSQISLQTDFYNGGYDMFDAFGKSFGSLEEKIGAINISSTKEEEFSIESIKPFFNSGKKPQVILSILSAPSSGFFLEKIKTENIESTLLASPTFIQELMIKKEKEEEFSGLFSGCSTWVVGKDHTKDKKFTENFIADLSRFHSPYTALGWEVSLFIERMLELELSNSSSSFSPESLDQSFLSHPIQGVRGILHFDSPSRSFLSELYWVEVSSDSIQVTEIEIETALSAWKQTLQKTPAPLYPGWVNTYLCS